MASISYFNPLTGEENDSWYSGMRSILGIEYDGGDVFACLEPSLTDFDVKKIDESTGEEMWSSSFSNPITKHTPLLDSNKVYVKNGISQGKVTALDRSDGSEVWTANLGGEHARTGIVYVGGSIYATSETSSSSDGYIDSIDPSDGSINWTYNLGNDTDRSEAVFANDHIYTTENSGTLHGVNSDGTSDWTTSISMSVPTMRYYNGELYVVEDNASDIFLRSYNLDDGSRIKDITLGSGGAGEGPPLIYDRVAYVPSTDGFDAKIFVYDLDSSSSLWSEQLNTTDGRFYSPAIKGNTLIVNYPGVLKAYNASTGNVKWENSSSYSYMETYLAYPGADMDWYSRPGVYSDPV